MSGWLHAPAAVHRKYSLKLSFRTCGKIKRRIKIWICSTQTASGLGPNTVFTTALFALPLTFTLATCHRIFWKYFFRYSLLFVLCGCNICLLQQQLDDFRELHLHTDASVVVDKMGRVFVARPGKPICVAGNLIYRLCTCEKEANRLAETESPTIISLLEGGKRRVTLWANGETFGLTGVAAVSQSHSKRSDKTVS